MPTATKLPTNEEFGRKVGCSHSMASRLRSGKRLPSLQLINRIADAYGIDPTPLVRAHKRGAESFGRALRKVIADGATS